MIKKILSLFSVILLLSFASCGGGGSSKEAKELLRKILQLVGIPQEIVINVCQDENRDGICGVNELQAKVKINKGDSVNDIWAKIIKSDNGKYFLETYDETLPILLEIKDTNSPYYSDKFAIPFNGFETKEQNETKELSILQSMIDIKYLTEADVEAIRNLNNQYAQDSFYKMLLDDLEININTIVDEGLDSKNAVIITIKAMANKLIENGVRKELPNRINACENNQTCIDNEIKQISDKLIIEDNDLHSIH